MTDPNPTVLLEILHQRKRVTKAEAADLAVTLKTEFDELLTRKFDFGTTALWAEAEKIATEAAAEAEKTVAERCEKLGVPREFAPGITSVGWRGPSLVEDRKSELRRVARTLIEIRLKATARAIEKHTLAAMQKIVRPAITARDVQAVMDDTLRLDELMRPIGFEEAEALCGKTPRSRRQWRDDGEMMMRSSPPPEPEDSDAEALRDEFRRLMD